MALRKNIELENGILLTYHRIASLNKITNITNIIEVASYVSQIKREEEAKYQQIQKKNYNEEELTEEEKALLNKGINVYVNTEFVQKEYNAQETIDEAYEYLKTLEKYEKAEDV